MAGGKETPRQKMIGMMYLVLTALLALQVSNAVLEKFAIINGALETLARETDTKNAEALGKIGEAAGTSSKDSVKLAYENAQKIREATKKVTTMTAALKAEMFKIVGSTSIDEKFINDHGSKVATMMIDPRNVKGKEYETGLNEYVKTLEALSMGEKFTTLARPPKDIPEFANDEDHIRKSFLEFTFENTPPIAAYASVSEMESQIYEYESRALSHLASIADASQLKFDRVFPMIKPEQNVVVAGSKYIAEMYIGASNPALNPVMFRDGQALPVATNAQGLKYGRVEFVAPSGGYDPKTGIAERKFKAKIDVKGQTFEEEISYKVIAPTVKITSGALSKLYMNCGNELNVEVPGLGTNFVPGYSSAEAEIVKGSKLGQITVIPKSKAKVKLAVSNSGSQLDVVSFDVRTPPAPNIIVQAGSKELNAKDGVSKNVISNLRVRAVADEDFANSVPKDAEFRIRKGNVFIRKGSSLSAPVPMQGETVNLASIAQTAKPGDYLFIEIENVTRRTFKGENETVSLSNQQKYISIPITN